MARVSNETKYFLRRAYRKNCYLRQVETQTLTDEIGPRLNAYLKSIGFRRHSVTDD
jgi:hypothetical protein